MGTIKSFLYLCTALLKVFFDLKMTVRFFLRSDKKTTPVTIWARVRTTDDDIRIPTEESIIATQWDKKAGMPKAVNKKADPELYEKMGKLSARLNDLRERLIIHIDQLDEKKKEISAKRHSDFIALEFVTEDVIPTAILPYLDWLLKQMKSGSFKHGSERYDADTIKAWNNFRNVYERFEKEYEEKTGKVLLWETLDKITMDAFVKYLEEYGYLIKTVNKYIITFKALIQYAYNHNLHDNTKCLRGIQKIKEIEGCATTKTYLNADEVQALFEMALEPGSLNDQVRDVFLIGVYTCQRVSDYANLKPSNFSTTAKGTKVIRIVQEKTGNSTVVPILNDNLQSLVEKYDYRIPHISDVIINRYIKKILKKLSETVPSLQESFRTILTLKEKKAVEAKTMAVETDEEGNVIKHKYELVSTHSARRSGITNLYKSKLFTTRQLMSISGHKTESSFYLYIAESADELADEIAEILDKAKKKESSNEELF